MKKNLNNSSKLEILFINPPSAFGAYKDSKVKVFKQVFPLLSFMSLSAIAKQNGFCTAVLDLGIEENPWRLLHKTLAEKKPRFIGITSTTPLFFEVIEISKIARKILGKEVIIIYGGPHASALPEESLLQSEVDITVRGEGEVALKEIMQGKKLSQIAGVYYKKGNKVFGNSKVKIIDNLDDLPFPDIELYDIKRYHCSKLVSRGSPVLHMETSRGCPHICKFCNKNIFGNGFRVKSPKRVIEEMKYFIKHGAREFRIIDDQFAANLNRAKEICRLMIKENIKVPWNLGAGVRVDRVDAEFLALAKKAGCYQVGVGFESGDQKALDSICKGIKLEQSIKAMEVIRKSGLESVGFFILGLPSETEESMQKTINFAKKLMPTYAKTTILIPFPGTPLFEEYDKKGLIKTKDWSKYNIHSVTDIYQHPNLTQKQLSKYYNKFYYSFYLNPRFIYFRVLKSLREGTIFRDAYYGVKTFL